MVIQAAEKVNGNNTGVDEHDDVTAEDIRQEMSDTNRFLGDAFHIDKLGIIRPGRMIPKSGCPADKVDIYNRLAAQGVSWDEIGSKMGNDGNGKSWLRMSNAEDFTLRADDCERPVHAELIKKLYADPTTNLLKKIPISFPFDDINMMITAQMSRYTKAGLQSTGRYVGDQLVCEKVDQTQASNVTTFGPKKKLHTPCCPEKCAFFQKKECKMRGGIIFRIPKVPGLGVWAVYTASYYSLVRIRSMMKTIKMMADGYCGLSQVPNMFYLTKTQEKIGSGENRKLQWILTIETDNTVDDIKEEIEKKFTKKNLIGAGANAARLLNGEKVDTTTGEVFDIEPLSPPAAENKPGATDADKTAAASPPQEPAKSAYAVSEPAPAATAQGSAPAQQEKKNKDGLDAEWPKDSKPAQAAAKPAQPAAAQTASKGKMFEGVPNPLGNYLEAVSKNAVFKSLPDFRSFLENICRTTFAGKSLAQLTGKDVEALRNQVQTFIKNSVPVTMNAAAPSSQVGASEGIY